MAAAPVKQIEELLECSICTETITQPRTLSCLHSFCNHCLTKFVAIKKEAVKKGAKVPEVFDCPVCRTPFQIKEGESIEKIPSNHFINNMLELLTLTQEAQSIKCQSCKARNPATSRCVSCENYLCGKCVEAHNNWPAFEDHVMLTLEELSKPENRAKARDKPRCEKHKKVLKFYCETCKVLVCRYCVDVNHPRPEHSWFPLTDVVGQHKEALKASCTIFEQQANEAAQSGVKIKNAISSLMYNARKAKDAIMQQQQEILSAFTKKLEQETAVLLDQVDMKYKETNELLMNQQADVKDYLERSKSLLDFTMNIISNASNEELLSLEHEIGEKARTIENERPKLMAPVHNGFIQYQAKASKDVLKNVDLNGLGKIVCAFSKKEELLKAKKPAKRRYYSPLSYKDEKQKGIIEKQLKSQNKKEILDDDNIGKLSRQQVEEIKELCNTNDLKVSVEQDLCRIIVTGHGDDISKTFAQIHKMLRRIGEMEKEKEKAALHADWAEIVSQAVQWFYVDPLNGDQDEYDKQINAMIEKAYNKKEKSVIFFFDDEECEIVFDDMEETNLKTDETMKVIRKDLKGAEVSVPEYWQAQPKDANGKDVVVHLVTLNPNDPKHKDEYKKVSDHFHQTAPQQRILQIQRVQNPFLFKQYSMKKQSLDDKSGSNEKCLFRGTNGNNLSEINKKGLNRSFAGNPRGVAYGKGVYFARDASMSAGYAPAMPDGKRYMYYTKAAVGQYTVGNQSMVVPPPKGGSGTDSYDSTVNNVANPTIIVLFYDNQYYPEYLITFN